MADETNTANSLELELSPPTQPKMFLVVYGEGQNQLLEIKPGETITVGRGRQVTISIPDRRLSRVQTSISLDTNQVLWFEEPGSTPLALINGKRSTGRTTLKSGDEIRVGPVTLVVGTFDKDADPEKRKSLVRPFSIFEAILPAELDRAARYKRPLSILMIRLSGDMSRDDVLGEVLGRNLRPMDLLSSYAPREFCIVLPEADEIQGLGVARRLLDVVNAAGGQMFVGVASYPLDGDNPETLIGRARLALKVASQGEKISLAPKDFEEMPPAPVFASAAMANVIELVEKAAASPLAVLILGERGVGKDVLVQEIHQRSPRASMPLVRINCASLPELLLESELFGYEEGAFQGAAQTHKGLFEVANGGTLFLDAIGEMSAATQSKLLRVLETKRIRRMGGTEEIPVDVRLITATHHNIDQMIEKGDFRPDLLFYLDTFTIDVPPLRERPEDILPLAELFLKEASREISGPARKLSPQVARFLCAYDWPGNVRELKNAMERAAVLAEGAEVNREHLSEKLVKQNPTPPQNSSSSPQTFALQDEVALVERETLIRALEACGGNRTHAAERLGISRRALLYKIEKYGLRDIGK